MDNYVQNTKNNITSYKKISDVHLSLDAEKIGDNKVFVNDIGKIFSAINKIWFEASKFLGKKILWDPIGGKIKIKGNIIMFKEPIVSEKKTLRYKNREVVIGISWLLDSACCGHISVIVSCYAKTKNTLQYQNIGKK